MANITDVASYIGKGIKAMAEKLPIVRPRPDLSDIYSQLSTSFETPLGRVLLELEQKSIHSLLQEYRGAKILHLTIVPSYVIESPSPFRYVAHVFSGINTDERGDTSNKYLVSKFDALPFASEQFDIVILQHVLEFSENPQGALKEAGRVTSPCGHLMVLGFNPLSLNGFVSAFMGIFRRYSFWDRRYLMNYRLRDWLKFIDFTFIQTIPLGYVLPISSERMAGMSRQIARVAGKLKLPFSAVTCIVSRKDQLGMNLLETKWRRISVSTALFSPSPTATSQIAERKILPFKK